MKEKFEQEQKDNHNHIEDLTMDMPDMEDDEKFRQWLEEAYINEAELIEKSLLAGQEYEKNLNIAEELKMRRMNRMTFRRFQRKRSEVSVQKLPEMLWRRRMMLLCQG